MPGLAFLYSSIRFSTSGVATRGLLPPMTPGRMLPVSWYRLRIFETHPCETRSCREIAHGLIPAAAISTIFRRMWFGSGLPLMNTPPSWLTRPCPAKERTPIITPSWAWMERRDAKKHLFASWWAIRQLLEAVNKDVFSFVWMPRPRISQLSPH